MCLNEGLYSTYRGFLSSSHLEGQNTRYWGGPPKVKSADLLLLSSLLQIRYGSRLVLPIKTHSSPYQHVVT